MAPQVPQLPRVCRRGTLDARATACPVATDPRVSACKASPACNYSRLCATLRAAAAAGMRAQRRVTMRGAQGAARGGRAAAARALATIAALIMCTARGALAASKSSSSSKKKSAPSPSYEPVVRVTSAHYKAQHSRRPAAAPEIDFRVLFTSV